MAKSFKNKMRIWREWKMSEKITTEKFGEIMNDFLKENKINMLITLPEGSIEPYNRYMMLNGKQIV